MNRSLARMGDSVFCPADAHMQCGGYVTLPVSGVIGNGSKDVFTNNQSTPTTNPAIIHDHVACVGPGMEGASRGFTKQGFRLESGPDCKMFINNWKAVRSGDPTDHCGSLPPAGQKGVVLPVCSTNTFG